MCKLSEMKPQQVSAEFVTNPQQGRTVDKNVQRLLIYTNPIILHYCLKGTASPFCLVRNR
jgi:hypothetical protein